MAGLGNPGRKYRHTRHNAGWMALDRIAESCGVQKDEDLCGGILARCGEIWLFKPMGYMNRSGPPVARICRRAGCGTDGLLVLVDDLALPLGRIRLRTGGSSGGHNGLKSVAAALGTDEFARLRIGIGPYEGGGDVRDYVLDSFRPDERETAAQATALAAEAAFCWAEEGIEAAMNRYNGLTASEDDGD